jgi:hypothetical protein
MYRILFSILYEISNSAIKPTAKLYNMEDTDFRELIILISHLGYIRGEILTFMELSLAGVTLKEKGQYFLTEHSYLLAEYPAKKLLPAWIREDSVYTRRL